MRSAWTTTARRMLPPVLIALSAILSAPVAAQAERPTVALVLGGGSARGAAHIGIIAALNEAGVPIDLIVGTSMGSVVGGLYAAGFSTVTLEELMSAWSPDSMTDLLFPPRGGLLDATPLEYVLAALVNDIDIEETAIPFAAVATPLETNVPAALTAGNLSAAVHASTAIPLVFAPVEIGGWHYYDGGIKAAVPVLIARSLGADVVIAVDVTREIPFDPNDLLSNAQTIYLDVIESYNRSQLESADLVLDPGLRLDSYMAFDRTRSFVEMGYRSTLQRLPDVLTRLETRGVPLRTPGDPNSGNDLNEAWRERMSAGLERASGRARPLSIGLDVGLSPSSYQSGTSIPERAPLSVARLGFDATGGALGPFRIGATAGFSLDSDDASLTFRLGYRPLYALELLAVWHRDPRSDPEVTLGAVYRYADFVDTTAEATLRVRLPSGITELGATTETTGFLATAAIAVPVSTRFVRASLDVRAALARDGFRLRARGFAGGISGGAPEGERFGFGGPVLMRGVPLAPATGVLVLNLEAGWQIQPGIPLAEVVVLQPEIWGFLDLGYAAPDRSSPAISLGVGAGVAGALFGLEPFDLSFDVGYGLTGGHLSFGLRTRFWPDPFVF